MHATFPQHFRTEIQYKFLPKYARFEISSPIDILIYLHIEDHYHPHLHTPREHLHIHLEQLN